MWQLALLAVYLALNMTLTLSNKAIFQRLSAPWLLTALHSAFAAAGCNLLMWIRGQKFTHLSGRDSLIVVTFSTLFTVNIAVSNVSLAMVSVPFHQTMRSLGPLFTVMLYWFLYGRHYSVWTQAALVPIVLGVCMLTYGDYEYDAAGFLLTILGVFLASLKTVATNRILTGSRALDPVEVLARMSPLAALQSAMIGLAVGEQADVIRMVEGWDLSRGILSGIVANSMLALLLNICSFNVNKLAGALAQTVSGNVKQCLTVLLAIPMFGVQIGRIDGLGMIASLAGAAWFSCVELLLLRSLCSPRRSGTSPSRLHTPEMSIRPQATRPEK
ncbi:hypothetical protein ANO11243_063530 [Dothideomycetidae sp. 11243]|nr:hypothetical protein ANO11243_063530 [fungal sp. No.11243]